MTSALAVSSPCPCPWQCPPCPCSGSCLTPQASVGTRMEPGSLVSRAQSREAVSQGRDVGSRMEQRHFGLQGSVPQSAAWCGGRQESQPSSMPGGQWWWLPGCPAQPNINSPRSCSSLPGPGETHILGVLLASVATSSAANQVIRLALQNAYWHVRPKVQKDPVQGVFRWPW